MEIAFAVVVVLAIILISVTLLFRRMFRYYSEYSTWRFPKALVSETVFLPGDILLFTCHAHGFVNSMFTHDFYTHSAIVVRDPVSSQLYLSESMIGDEVMPHPTKDDVELMAGGKAVVLPLYARLKHYPGPGFLMRLTPTLDEEQANHLWDLAQQEVPYPDLKNSLMRLLGLSLLLEDGGRTHRHCMAHVAWMLDNMGLTPTALLARGDKTNSGPFLGMCKRVTRISGEPLGGQGEWSYLPPVHLLYDIDTVDVPVQRHHPLRTKRAR